MKKFLSLLLAIITVFALSACGSGSGSADAGTAVGVKDPLELMSAVWGSYAEDEKFSVMGGDFDHGSTEGPDVYAVDDAATLNSVFGLPEEMASKVDSAASLMHMMNANTFTGVAFHIKDSGDVSAVAQALQSSVMSRQWMCGFPDKLVIITLGDYVISVFGNEELVDNFKAKTAALYESASVVCDEPIA